MGETEKKIHTRRMPTEGAFISYDSNDILYTIMYSLATYNPVEKKLYLAKSNLTANKKLIYSSCDFSGSAMMKRHLSKLIEKNLIEEDENNYYFPYDINQKYRIVEKDMLFYLATTRSLNAIRVYMILLDGFLWKSKEQNEFNFTNAYLLDKMGYSTNNKNASVMITNILESFSREGVIIFEELYESKILSNGLEVPSPKKYLKFIATTKQEIKS